MGSKCERAISVLCRSITRILKQNCHSFESLHCRLQWGINSDYNWLFITTGVHRFSRIYIYINVFFFVRMIRIYNCFARRKTYNTSMQNDNSKGGYLARKRKLRHGVLDKTTDEYGTWLCSSGLTHESAKGFIHALDSTIKKNKGEKYRKVLSDMRLLLSSNPILAQDICLDYQQCMKSRYEKLLPGNTVVSKKKKGGT
jgi:hypothetical protein